jgi:hypothetical protein
LEARDPVAGGVRGRYDGPFAREQTGHLGDGEQPNDGRHEGKTRFRGIGCCR